MTTNFTESVVDDAALAWLESLGYAIKHGPEIAPGELFAERGDYGQVILADWLRQALVRLNPALPSDAIDDAFREAVGLQERLLKELESRRLSRVSIEVAE
jgi:type I restriction enzyme R subunit